MRLSINTDRSPGISVNPFGALQEGLCPQFLVLPCRVIEVAIVRPTASVVRYLRDKNRSEPKNE
jgi:hypothetical protein